MYAYGRFVGFLTGWASWVISWITIAMLVSACMEYLIRLPGVHISHHKIPFMALFILIILSIFNYLSATFGAKLQRFFSTITITVLGIFIIGGCAGGMIDPDYYFIYKMPDVNLALLLVAAAIIIEPFIGWETVTFLGGQAKNPEKTVPNALVKSTIYIVILYSLVVFVALGVTNYQHLANSAVPLEWAAGVFLGKKGATFISIEAVIILLGTTNSWVMAASRLPFELSHNKRLTF